MAEDEFHSSEHGVQSAQNNSIPFRMASSEHALRELERFSDELRLAKQLHDEQISTLKTQHTAQDNHIEALRKELLDNTKTISERITTLDGRVTEERSRSDIATTKMKSTLETSIADMRTDVNITIAKVRTDLDISISNVKSALDARIEGVNTSLSSQFNENKNYFSRWFLALAVGITVSMIIVIFSRVLTIPGAHV